MAQCTTPTPISTFPYTEGFEASEGNWVRSSVAHWEWGQINNKPLITAAGGGLKCWIVGGYSGSQYNSGSSFVQSPCFDISSLSKPEISFKVFWETERRYDGVSFQYSLDGGLVWNVLGAANSNDGCSIQNWFNYDPIFTSNLPGWSGNIQQTSGSCQGGGGSGQWVTATHTLASIAGATNVMFRFYFSAGTTCNNFDGFAFDDVRIGEAPVNSTNFTYTCGANNSIDFTALITGCTTAIDWNFGDMASGANNTSTAQTPTHIFTSPGSYTITLNADFVSGPSIAVTKTINVIAVNTSAGQPVACNSGHDGSATVTVNPPSGSYNYAWDTNPVQTTATITGLGAGTYTVTVSGTNVCTTSSSVTLTDPPALAVTTTITDATCKANNGSIATAVSGGTGTYTYTWSNSSAGPSINDLSPGVYSVLVTDANGCMVNTGNLTIKSVAVPVSVSLGKDTTICPNTKIILAPGSFASYLWQDNSTAPAFTVNSAGTYSVKVTDAIGCTGTASVNILPGCLELYFPSAFTPNSDGRNETFGPLPSFNLSSVKNYRLTIYGRWGEVLFTSTDPYKKWDGTFKGKPLPTQVCTWTASYTQNNLLPEFRSGTISIIR